MEIDWKTVLTVVVTALMSAGGTVGAQSYFGSQPQQPQAFQLVKGMTGLCIKVEEQASPKIVTGATK